MPTKFMSWWKEFFQLNNVFGLIILEIFSSPDSSVICHYSNMSLTWQNDTKKEIFFKAEKDQYLAGCYVEGWDRLEFFT